jgi:hypothetical protein
MYDDGFDDDYADFGKRRVGRPRGRKGARKTRKSIIVKGRKRKIYRGKNGALYYRSRSGKVYLSARRMRKMRKARKGRKARRGRRGRKLKMTKSAIAARRAYRRRRARMSFFGA